MVSLITAVSLVLASIWCAIWSAQKVSFKLCSLDAAVWASEAWTTYSLRSCFMAVGQNLLVLPWRSRLSSGGFSMVRQDKTLPWSRLICMQQLAMSNLLGKQPVFGPLNVQFFNLSLRNLKYVIIDWNWHKPFDSLYLFGANVARPAHQGLWNKTRSHLLMLQEMGVKR